MARWRLMAGWIELAAALALSVLAHALAPRTGLRAAVVRHLGERGFVTTYSLVALLALGWLAAAAGRARHVELCTVQRWHVLVLPLVMQPASLLAALAIGAPNPLSFGGGRHEQFDPERPGVVGIARHPLLWALVLWAAAHLVANDDLARVLLLGPLDLFTLIGMAMLDRRRRRVLGADRWAELARCSAMSPLAALLTGRWSPAVRSVGVARAPASPSTA